MLLTLKIGSNLWLKSTHALISNCFIITSLSWPPDFPFKIHSEHIALCFFTYASGPWTLPRPLAEQNLTQNNFRHQSTKTNWSLKNVFYKWIFHVFFMYQFHFWSSTDQFFCFFVFSPPLPSPHPKIQGKVNVQKNVLIWKRK